MFDLHDERGMGRRDFLRTIGLGAGALALSHYGIAEAADLGRRWMKPDAARDYILTLANSPIYIGQRRVVTSVFGGQLPGPEIRLTEGERLRVLVHNHLAESASVHWHGIPIVNNMDGVPNVTQPPINAGTDFTYDFKVPYAGTYWYHSHSAVQLDRGVYGPLIVTPKKETLSYDREYTLILDDWKAGFKTFEVRENSNLLGCDLENAALETKEKEDASLPAPGKALSHFGTNPPPAEPLSYPDHLINGRPPTAPTQIVIKKGEVVRLRIINAASATTYRVAIAGHRMRVTHTDGLAAKPVDVDTLDISMAERYDVLIYGTNPGVWQIAAQVPGQGVRARAILKYQGSNGHFPPAAMSPRALNGSLLTLGMLQAADNVEVQPPTGKPDMSVRIDLNSRFGSFFMRWNGQILPSDVPVHIPMNKHIRFVIANSGSSTLHPMHLHGHSFQVLNGTPRGPMKDTVIVAPFQTVTVDWTSDNPGLWMFHCHNLYHMLDGLMLILKVS